MKKNPSYKLAVVISVLLHVVVLSFLFFHFTNTKKTGDESVKIINAVVVNKSSVAVNRSITKPINKELTPVNPVASKKNIEKIEQKTLHQHEIEPPKLEKKVEADKEEAQLDKPSLAKPDSQQQKLLAAEKLKQKKLAEKQKQLALAKKRRAEEAKKLQRELEEEKQAVAEESESNDESTNEEKNESEQLTQNLETDLRSEQQELSAAKAEAAQAELDIYKQKIIQAISQKWLMPEIENQQEACQLLVHLGPGGVVVSVDIVKESGDSALDRSARTAVMKASPLPVPDAPELFDKFRSLRLTFRPQGVVAG